MYLHNKRCADDARDWRDVAEENEIELVVKRRVDRLRCLKHEQCIAVGVCARDDLSADIGCGARSVLNDEGLAEPLRQPWSDNTREDVGRASRRERHDVAHRPRRIGICLCPGDARYSRERCNARRQQELSTEKFMVTLHELTARASVPYGVGDEFGNRLGWNRWINHHDEGHDKQA
jgi:hypothetical protein